MDSERSSVWGGGLRSKEPNIAGSGHHSAEQDIIQEAAAGGIRTRGQDPARAVPMQQQSHLVFRAAGGKVRTVGPDVGRRNGGHVLEPVGLILTVRSDVRAGYHTPTGAVV